MSRSVFQNERNVPFRLGPVVEATLRGTSGWPVYQTTPSASAGIAWHVVFLHGGGYLQDIAWSHWRLVNDLTRGVPARCIVPIFPLAPGVTASEVVPAVGNLLRDLLKEIAPGQLTVVGSSAGAGLALAASQWLRDRGCLQPKALVLISPWLDATMALSGQPTVAPRHHVQASAGRVEARPLYDAGDLDVSHPFVSPLNGGMHGLPPLTVFTGTNDLFHSDSMVLAELAERSNTSISVHIGCGLPHNYALMPTSEGHEARTLIARICAGSETPLERRCPPVELKQHLRAC